ncbi:hypothetical protein SAMN05216316_2021 [Nitrosovibrio sp. Nv6]|nr:hypothetical protein SAMN05216316_2021 [Nitrosovibrio sp. Nv6]
MLGLCCKSIPFAHDVITTDPRSGAIWTRLMLLCFMTAASGQSGHLVFSRLKLNSQHLKYYKH